MRSYVHIYALLLIVSHARFGAALEEVTVGPVEEHGDDVINTVCKTRQYMTENYGIERVVEREQDMETETETEKGHAIAR